MLEFDDHYRNIYNGCRLPHDSIIFDDEMQDELESMSGEVVTYNLSDLGGENIEKKSGR